MKNNILALSFSAISTLSFGGNHLSGELFMKKFQPMSFKEIIQQEEAIIDDIPFDTREIYQQVLNEKHLEMIEEIRQLGKQEAFIDDIPFDTRKIFEQSQLN